MIQWLQKKLGIIGLRADIDKLIRRERALHKKELEYTRNTFDTKMRNILLYVDKREEKTRAEMTVLLKEQKDRLDVIRAATVESKKEARALRELHDKLDSKVKDVDASVHTLRFPDFDPVSKKAKS